jgi:prepilin-type N-terminal cleavage/methylation domain-containing protein/prepilin-type processing-associated H-X9-DG protein
MGIDHISRALRARSGFTLVELLVVIVIIAVLAGLLLPVLGRVTDNANSTKCVSNLRQIGTAINAYANDNEDQLPGPLAQSQFPVPGEDEAQNKGALRVLLAKYLGADGEKTTDGAKLAAADRTNVFLCPGYEKNVKQRNGPAYVMSTEKITELEQSPWGGVEAGKEPVKRAMLTSWTEDTEDGPNRPVQPTRIWAMKDVDKEAFREGEEQPAGFDKMAAKPVHGDHRNALFYDWHVAKMPLDDREFTIKGNRK